MNFGDTTSDINFEPSRATGGRRDNSEKEYSQAPLSGTVKQSPITKTLNFKQAGELYESFNEMERANLIANLAGDLGKVKDKETKTIMVSHFYQANADYGTKLAKAVDVSLEDVKKLIK